MCVSSSCATLLFVGVHLCVDNVKRIKSFAAFDYFSKKLRLGSVLVSLQHLLALGAQQPVHQVDGKREHHSLVLLSADAVQGLKGGNCFFATLQLANQSRFV